MQERILAAIDLGTNSFHIILVRVKPDGSFESLGREKESVRLGSGAGITEVITPEAIERGLACLLRFKQIADLHGAEIRAVATSAIREAKNKEDFLKKVDEELGIHIEVVSGYEEARLIYYGILQGLPIFDKRIMMVDIGGGSTEILIGEKGEILFAQSLKMGAIRLTDKFFNGDPDNPSDIMQCKMYVQSMLTPLKKSIESFPPELVVGSSGTIQSIAQMALAGKNEEIPRMLNNHTLTQWDVKKVRAVLDSADTLKKRTKIPGLESKRADIIVAGSIILEEIFNRFSVKEMKISDYALREGVIYDTIKKWSDREAHNHSLDNIRYRAVTNLFNSFPFEKDHVYHTVNLCMKIYDDLLGVYMFKPETKEYLEAAAMLHEIGFGISHSSHHKHSYYIISNSEMMVGYNFEEIEMIALIARYHRKSTPKPKHIEFNRLNYEQQMIVKKMAAILRIADGLDRSRQGVIEDITTTVSGNNVTFTLKVKEGKEPTIEIWSANQKKDLFCSVFNANVEFVTRG
jgi:exopolyphosphatase / guanosine-5'-triphosphate,3'-diphosphate pyrophosphatase